MASTSGYSHLAEASATGSFSPLLNRQVLYVKDIDLSATKDELEAILQPLCPQQLGTVKVPVNYQTGNIMGYAYLNFYTQEDAAMVLEEWRFKLFIYGKPVKILYAMVAREALNFIFGPQGQSHVVFVNNISPEVDAAALFERFRLHGEVFTCEVVINQYNLPYGLVHYMEEASVPIAVQAEDHSHFHHTIIKVSPHQAAAGHLMPAQPKTAPLVLQSSTDFPSLGAAPSGSGRTSQTGSEHDAQYHGQHLASGFMIGNTDMRHMRAPRSYYDEQEQHVPGATSNGMVTSLGSPAKQHSHNGPLQQPAVAAAAAAASTGKVAMHPVFGRLVQQRDSPISPAGPPGGIPVPVHKPAATTLTAPAPVHNMPAAASSNKDDGQSVKPARKAVADEGRQSAKDLVKATLSHLERLSDMLCCPITQEPFEDPVVAADGHSYERKAIEAWIAKSATSPLTNTKLAHKNLLPNTLIKHLCEEFS